MAMPLPSNHMNIGTGWRYSKGGLHAAFDYPVPIGTPIFAVRNGTILDCNDGVANNRPGEDGKTGDPSNWILLGITYRGRAASVYYQHLSPGLDVKKGQRVSAGQKLGETGNSGHTTGPHLHLATMRGHRHAETRYAYLKDIGPSEGAPNGVASNGACIFPPSLVFGAASSGRWASGLVIVDQLKFGTKDSNSVRRLQHRLNEFSLVGGRELPISGNYLELTKDQVTRWQIQKDGCAPGTAAADGNLGPKQARDLFGTRYEIRDHS